MTDAAYIEELRRDIALHRDAIAMHRKAKRHSPIATLEALVKRKEAEIIRLGGRNP